MPETDLSSDPSLTGSSDARIRIRISPALAKVLQDGAAKRGVAVESFLSAAVSSYVDRNTSPYNLDRIALIQEVQLLRQTIEILALTCQQLGDVYQLVLAQDMGSISELLTELSKSAERRN
jgi:hypothetical protein